MGVTVAGPLRLPRRFSTHLGALGNEYRRHYISLQEQLGEFKSELVRQAAADCAQAHVVKILAVRAWETAQHQRLTGIGRRPNIRQVVQLQKRIALESQSYTLAFNRLQELLGTPKRSAHDDLVKQYGGGA